MRAASFAPASTRWRAQICHIGTARARPRLVSGFLYPPGLLPWLLRWLTGFPGSAGAGSSGLRQAFWPGEVWSCFP